MADCLRHALTASLTCYPQVSEFDERNRDLIEQGPPEDLVANFDRLFRDKVEATRELAREAARVYGLLPELS